MTAIPIKNVYYMLSYAFQVLQEDGYKKIETEEFHNTAELCAAILARGVSYQLRKGLGKEYVGKSETLSTLKGRIEVSESIKELTVLRNQLICSYDDFTVDTRMNRIIKATMLLLLRMDISKERKKELKKMIIFFGDVSDIDIHSINWKMQYSRNNQTYRMLISICYLVIKGLLQTSTDGSMKLMDYLDEQRMCKLYERFILEYYRKEHRELVANASQISWQLDDEESSMLPIMKSDIMLSKGERYLIIDAKYYEHILQSYYGANSINSANLYQIFTYVKNKEAELTGKPHTVSGMLLYAKTNEMMIPNNTYKMSGNLISVKTLDLNCDFQEIARQLDEIADSYFE